MYQFHSQSSHKHLHPYPDKDTHTQEDGSDKLPTGDGKALTKTIINDTLMQVYLWKKVER